MCDSDSVKLKKKKFCSNINGREDQRLKEGEAGGGIRSYTIYFFNVFIHSTVFFPWLHLLVSLSNFLFLLWKDTLIVLLYYSEKWR